MSHITSKPKLMNETKAVTHISQSTASINAMSADEMPITCNTIVLVTIGTDPVIGAAATDANVAAML